MDPHSMAADLDRRFGGQNVFRFAGDLSDNPDMTVVIDLNRNPCPYRGAGVGMKAAYIDALARGGAPISWIISVPPGGLAGIGIEKFRKTLLKTMYQPIPEEKIERRGESLVISTRDIGLSDLRSLARKCKWDMVIRLEGVL